MNTWANNLFYIVFLGQIFLASYWLPRVILGRLGELMEKHPPSTHPKLYPKPIAYYRRGMAGFKWFSRVIFLLGFVVLYGVYTLDQGKISEIWPATYGAVQFLPLMALELAGFRHFKLMREANARRTRSAALSPRRLLDYVSRRLLTLAIASFLIVIGLDLAINDFHLVWNDATQRDLTMVGTNGLLAIVGLWHLYGRKLDPYQASDDRLKQIKVQLNYLLLISTAFSLFLMFQSANDVYDLKHLDAPLMSLYFTLIFALSILLPALVPADVDFSVYTNDPSKEKQ